MKLPRPPRNLRVWLNRRTDPQEKDVDIDAQIRHDAIVEDWTERKEAQFEPLLAAMIAYLKAPLSPEDEALMDEILTEEEFGPLVCGLCELDMVDGICPECREEPVE